MTYESQGKLGGDMEFQQRVSACMATEFSTWVDKPTTPMFQMVSDLMPYVAASPGFSDKYLWGVQAQGIEPGQLAITDGEILATVQPMLERYRPVEQPPIVPMSGP